MRTFRVQRGKPSKDSAVIPEGRTQWYDTQLPLQTEEYLTMELEGFVSAADPLPAFDYTRIAPQKGHCPPATNFREITLNRWTFIMQVHGSNGLPLSELVEKPLLVAGGTEGAAQQTVRLHPEAARLTQGTLADILQQLTKEEGNKSLFMTILLTSQLSL